MIKLIRRSAHDSPRRALTLIERSRRAPRWMWALLLFSLAATLFTFVGTEAARAPAQRSKARLDAELRRAHVDLGIPDIVLAPWVSQERQVALRAGAWNADAYQATVSYDALYQQLLDLEQTDPDTLRDQVHADIDTFTQALDTARSQGFSEAPSYQARMDQAMRAAGSSPTSVEEWRLDDVALAQTAALRDLWPAFLRLQAFGGSLRTLRLAGLPSTLGEQLYEQDRRALRETAPAQRYALLDQTIAAHMLQTQADQVNALSSAGGALLSAFAARADLLRLQGESESARTLQQDIVADTHALAEARQPFYYLELARTLDQQISALALPLARAQARQDLAALRQLIRRAQARRLRDPFTRASYPAAYEYADDQRGVGEVARTLSAATSLEAVQQANDTIGSLAAHLHAYLDNLDDRTSRQKTHATDLALMTRDDLLQGKVIVVSLSEQIARFYEDGQLLSWTDVTTGRIDRPTPPGLHYAMEKSSPTLFVSADPPGSRLWFAPTTVQYSILFATGGFFLHDASWRGKFGLGTNLPHRDPAAFNGGSHGCVNLPESTMRWVYDWTPVGTPILVY